MRILVKDFLVDGNEEYGEFLENFECYEQSEKVEKKKNLSIATDFQEYLSTNKSDDKHAKLEDFSEQSYVYSNSIESENAINIQEIPTFATRFLGDDSTNI